MQIGSITGGATGWVSATAKAASVSYDPRDLNQDGVVSAQEAYLYELRHPSTAASSTPTPEAQTGLYDARGSVTAVAPGATFQAYA